MNAYKNFSRKVRMQFAPELVIIVGRLESLANTKQLMTKISKEQKMSLCLKPLES